MDTDLRLAMRLQGHEALSRQLAALGDAAFAAWDSEPDTWRGHIFGSRSRVVDLGGAKVFLKQIPLTALEQGHPGSTANLFNLPSRYHYGVGSAGFNAWRELDAYLKAHAWATSGECPHFPLVHHWRLLPRTAPVLSRRQLDWLEQAPAYWADLGPVAERLAALEAAQSSVVLCLEFHPQPLETWLETAPPAHALASAYAQLDETAAFMNARGMLHFDLHGKNILTDGEQVYVTDFGLGLCADHDLSADERTMLATHRLYDRAYLDWAFDHWLKPFDTPDLTPLRAKVRPAAQAFEAFYNRLSQESRLTPYPAADIDEALTQGVHP